MILVYVINYSSVDSIYSVFVQIGKVHWGLQMQSCGDQQQLNS